MRFRKKWLEELEEEVERRGKGLKSFAKAAISRGITGCASVL